jgi:ABC-type transporter Mla subunit MlaD
MSDFATLVLATLVGIAVLCVGFVVWAQGLSKEEREKIGHGEKGQGRD